MDKESKDKKSFREQWEELMKKSRAKKEEESSFFNLSYRTKENILSAIFIIVIGSLIYFINPYYIGQGIVYFTAFVAVMYILSMIKGEISSGVIFAPLLIMLVIGAIIMNFSDENKPVLKNNSTEQVKNISEQNSLIPTKVY